MTVKVISFFCVHTHGGAQNPDIQHVAILSVLSKGSTDGGISSWLSFIYAPPLWFISREIRIFEVGKWRI